MRDKGRPKRALGRAKSSQSSRTLSDQVPSPYHKGLATLSQAAEEKKAELPQMYGYNVQAQSTAKA